MRELNLDILKEGLPGITPKKGAALLEAIAFCLEKCDHQSGDLIKVSGDINESVILKWEEPFDNNAALTYNDEQELVEDAATGIALCFMNSFTKYKIFLRSRKGTGADFWIGTELKDDKSIQEGLLEISGIMKESKNNTLVKRASSRKTRLENSPFGQIPKFLIVIEFATPKTKVLQL